MDGFGTTLAWVAIVSGLVSIVLYCIGFVWVIVWATVTTIREYKGGTRQSWSPVAGSGRVVESE
jgi:hypothetical protein